MSKKLLSLVLGLGISLLCTANAKALFLLTQADIDANDPDAPGGANLTPLELVEIITTNGRTFTNTYAPPTGGVLGDAGTHIRAIIAGELTNLRNGVNNNPVLGPGTGTDSLIFVAAFDGVLTNPSTQSLTFTAARLGLFSTSGTFLSQDPTTWGFGTAAAPGPHAAWDLKPRAIAP